MLKFVLRLGKYLAAFGKYLVAFVTLIALFCGAMYLVCSFDSQLLQKHVQVSSATLKAQGQVPIVFTALYVQNDNFTDAVMINEMYSVDCAEPFISSQKVRKNYRAGLTTTEMREMTGPPVSILCEDSGNEVLSTDAFNPIIELSLFLSGKIHSSLNYGRYWHGYLVVYRPLLLLFDITQMRNLFALLYCALLAWFVRLLYRRFGRDIALIFAASLVGGGYFTASFSLQATCTYLTLMVSSIILLRWLDKIRDFHLFLFVVACVTNFFDYLTVPLITLGVPVAIRLLKIRQEGRSWFHCLRQLIISSAIWLLGYAGTWLAKWAVYDIFINDGQSMIGVGITQFVYRISRNNVHAPMFQGKDVFLTIMIIGRATLWAVITAGVLMYWHKCVLAVRGFNRWTLPYLLLALIPVAWYLIAANHTEVHYYFTFRLSALFTLGILLAMHELFWGKPPALAAPSGTPDKDAPTPD